MKNNLSRFDVHGLNNIDDILITSNIPESYKIDYIFYKVFNNSISPDDLKNYLIKIDGDLDSNYKKLLCLYDFKNTRISKNPLIEGDLMLLLKLKQSNHLNSALTNVSLHLVSSLYVLHNLQVGLERFYPR